MIHTKLFWNTIDKRFEVELSVSMAPDRWQRIVENFRASKANIESFTLTLAVKKKLGISTLNLKPTDIVYD